MNTLVPQSVQSSAPAELLAAIHRSCAVARFSLDGRLEWANDLFLAAAGRIEDHDAFVHPSERSTAEHRAFWSELRSGRSHSGRFRRVREDGSDLRVQAVYTPVLDAAGRPIEVMCLATAMDPLGPPQDALRVEDRRLVDEMRSSIVAGDFYLEYQPRFDVRTREMHGVEALVRWCHPERGRISPMEFVPLAERTGLIVPLSDWILQRACHTAARWAGVAVSVNLSPVQFHDDDLVRKVSAALTASGLAPHLLELEVTEGVLVSDSRRALEVLEALKAIGVRLAIDDFGTGYSSLSYLRNFPFDVIKIDRSFVRDLDAPKSSRPIVQAILALGRALGMSVTAEGVETAAQLEILAADGCDEVQGFLLARPSPASVIDEIAARRTAAA